MLGSAPSRGKATPLAIGLVVGLGIGLAIPWGASTTGQAWTAERPSRGPQEASVTIEEYTDYECPACRQYHRQTYDSLTAEYGDRIRYRVRQFPLKNIHPHAEGAARAAVCANQQGHFWEFHESLFRGQEGDLSQEALLARGRRLSLDMDRFQSCLESESSADEVAGDILHGVSRGVRSTPTFFVNNRRLVGAQPLDSFRSAIEAELAAAQESAGR